jgi:hypothetical protein
LCKINIISKFEVNPLGHLIRTVHYIEILAEFLNITKIEFLRNQY